MEDWMGTKSQGRGRCALAAEPHNLFMRGKVTANQTQTQANQQIALSPALRAMCSRLDRNH